MKPPPWGASAPVVSPATAALLERAHAMPAIDPRSIPLLEARDAFLRLNEPRDHPVPMIAEVRALVVPGAAGIMRGRLYRASSDPRRPLIVFVHGGGWTFGNVDTHDRCMRLLAIESGAAVLGIDYRLAPEHPFPAALDDTLATLDWLVRDAAAEGLEPARVALAGDSAGANIALATLIALRDRRRWSPVAAALFYGCYAPLPDTNSHRRFGDGAFLLTTEKMNWYWRNYLGPLDVASSSLATPLRAPLHGLPRLYLNAAGLDPLLDDTLLLAMRLAHAGTACELDIVPGVVHGFLQHTHEEPLAMAALQRAARHLAAALAA